MRAGDLHQGLLVLLDDHLQAAINQALPALGALEAAGLPSKNIQNVHRPVFTPSGQRLKLAKLIAAESPNQLTVEVELLLDQRFAQTTAGSGYSAAACAFRLSWEPGRSLPERC